MAMAEWYDDHVFGWQEIANQFFGVVVPFHIPVLMVPYPLQCEISPFSLHRFTFSIYINCKVQSRGFILHYSDI